MAVGSSLPRKARSWIVKSMLAIAAALPLANAARADLLTVDSLTTIPGLGTPSSTSEYGAHGSTQFKKYREYDITWLGNTQTVNSITAGGTTYNFITPADEVYIRTNYHNKKAPDRQSLYYQGSVTGSNITLQGQRYNSLSDALRSNDIFTGVDNLFTNRKGGNGHDSRTERLDVIFSNGITAAANKLFGVFDRGDKNAHDPFKIAAITSIDANGKPTGYGDVLAVEKGWGQASVLGSKISTVVLRNSKGNADLTSPSAIIPQPVGGILIPLDDLVGEGVTIYGYSLFAYDICGSGNALLDWKKFDKKTDPSDGGLDLLAFTGLIELNAIPEPAALSLIGLAGLTLMRRRCRA